MQPAVALALLLISTQKGFDCMTFYSTNPVQAPYRLACAATES